MSDDFIGSVLGVGVALALICLIGGVVADSEPECMEAGCSREQSAGSIYCYLHKSSNYSYTYKSSVSTGSSSGGSNTSSGKTNSSNTSKYTSGNKSSSSTKASGTSSGRGGWDSYDEGYEDMYDSDDYDWDRYNNDPDYADGVEDALEDLGY